jgi:C4-dicarboxylate-specific signal transduction histidine kinase
MADENLRLRAALRDLVALSTIPAGWIGIEPRTIAAGLADILAGSLGFDFAFVRLLDPTGGLTIDVTSGCATREYLDWLQAQLSTLDESLRKQIIPNVVGFDDRLKSLRGIIIPIGFNAYAGLVAVGCERSEFPTETDRMLLTVAANHAATAFRSANLIHERRRAEEEVRKARDELEMKVMERTAELQRTMAELTHMNRVVTLGEMTASIAHEVNQPLSGISSNAEACLRWLDRGTPNLDAARRSVEWIINDCNRAGEVIQRVRALAKRTDIQKAPLHINDIVDEVISLVQREMFDHRVSLRKELASTLPMVFVDRIQLQQVIINLVINGIEAMQSVTDRPRELTIRSRRDGEQQVLVTVKDGGVGIAAENADRLFSAFFTTKPTGMGMGLSIGRSIIEAHGGRLWAEANLPHGAAFHFTLPLGQEDAS